jgi:hypothetical protein
MMSLRWLRGLALAAALLAPQLSHAQLPPGGGGGGGGGGAVYGPTAAGSPAANPPVLLGGTIDGTATGNVDNLKVSGGNGYVNLSQIGGTNVLTS